MKTRYNEEMSKDDFEMENINSVMADADLIDAMYDDYVSCCTNTSEVQNSDDY